MQLYSHVSDVPLALAVWLATDTYDHDDDPFTISATTLLKPTRQIVLAARVKGKDLLTPLPEMINSRFGQSVHDGIERAWLHNHKRALQALGYPQHVIDRVLVNPSKEQLLLTPGAIPVYLEQRLKRKFGRWTVTGKFDFIGEGKVQDFKSTTVWVYLNQVNNNKYALQGSIYRCLGQELITQDVMDIHFIFKDWNAGKARSAPDDYPRRAYHTQTFRLHSVPDTERFIVNKIAQIEKYWDAKEKDIPDCDDEELWRSEPEFKYYKNPQKMTRSTKNFDTKAEAYQRWSEDGGVGVVKEIPGEVTACKYCPSFPVCGQKDRLIAAGELKMLG